MKRISAIAALGLFSFSVSAQQVTWSEHIAPIVFEKCTPCHRTGEVAPFPLTNYSEAQSWSGMMQYVTSIGYMPPWKADPDFQRYQKETFLTEAEKQLIEDWVTGGAVQGDPNLEPPFPVFPTGSQIGTPDLVLSFAESYMHEGNNQDEYRYFVLPTGLMEDKDLIALEVRPGNNSIVHHTLCWQDTTGEAAADDAATPEYGYEGGSAFAGLDFQLPGYVPGASPVIYTNGIAQKIHAGADIKMQMHYAPFASDEYDSTTVNLFFAEQPATRYMRSHVMLPFFGTLTNPPFIIPANETREFHGTWTLTEDVSLYGIGPHMHLLGTHWEVFAVKPDGDTLNMIRINDWDFNWQGGYQFKQLYPAPAGTVIHAYAGYDNTINNPYNPYNPPQTITWGEGTEDEMYYLPIQFLDYQEGDENVIFEDDLTGVDDLQIFHVEDELYPVAPNPTRGEVKIGFTLEKGGKVNLTLVGLNGQLVETITTGRFYLPGLHTMDIDLSGLSAGIYNLVFEKDGNRQVQQVSVTEN